MRATSRKVLFLVSTLVLAWATAATGAPGDPLIIGAKNDGGSSTTVLKASPSTSQPVFRVSRSGSVAGPALRGDGNGAGHGVVGTTENANRFGVWGQGAGAGSFGMFSSGDLGLTGDLRDTGALDVLIGGTQRALRLEPATESPNVIGGFSGNSTTAGVDGAAIGGGGASGGPNRVLADHGTIAGGSGNSVSESHAVVGGGGFNTASGHSATVAGGNSNVAGVGAAVGGGLGNDAGDLATVGGGFENTASGITSMVPGGENNVAAGRLSFAAGRLAQTSHQGTYVWADSQNATMASSDVNQWISRAQGDFYFQSDSTLDEQSAFINTSTGAHLTHGGTWTNASDVNVKEDFEPVDPQRILQGVAELPLSTWSYIAEDGEVRHLGPMGQDFQATFGLGADERSIATVDADGVALAAIQGLNRKVEAQEARIVALEGQVAAGAMQPVSTSSSSPTTPVLYLLGSLAVGLGMAVGGFAMGQRRTS